MEQEAKVCAGGCIRNYADPLPHCDDCSFRQPDEQTTDISYERAAEILDPTHREHYDSMNEIERAIAEIIGTNYGENQCHRETMVLAAEALREKAEREKGCEYCLQGEDLAYGLDSMQRTGRIYIDGNLLTADLYSESMAVAVCCCPMCGRELGKRLEVERGN